MNCLRIPDLVKKKQQGEKLTMLTAYDYLFAKLLDEAGIDILLVGDSVGMVLLGYETTLPVTLEMMIHHSQAVSRGAQRAFVIADMPFLSYQVSISEAVRNAGRLIQEGGVSAVKIEGGKVMADVVHRLVDVGIPVMGHLGLLPQSVHQLGGFRIQAKNQEDVERLLEDAKILEEAGAFSIVLESIPANVALQVTSQLSIPTIGIGAGPHCDGQVLVSHDVFGLSQDNTPNFVKQYAQLGTELKKAVAAYVADVQAGNFPSKEHFFDGEIKANSK
ncbi:MAG: 3-methyl-2-oxobutanoate hydroxymethyltransferase [Acidobacteriota bacterium]|nr:3-methyl-2-oxobutanoate hydroxymethyltransferase [Acidobacteriota bacterium]